MYAVMSLWTRTLPLALIVTGAISAVSYGPMLWAYGSCLRGTGGWDIGGVEFQYGIAMVFVPGALLGGSIGTLFRQTRLPGKVLVLSGALVALLFVPVTAASDTMRSVGFARAARRAQPLVEAITRFDAAEGHPPATLDELVPKYLPSLPERLPPLQIVTGPDALKNYHSNRWVLRAEVSTGILNWDVFLYFPNQAYPETGYGGWLEPIGTWAYVHE